MGSIQISHVSEKRAYHYDNPTQLVDDQCLLCPICFIFYSVVFNLKQVFFHLLIHTRYILGLNNYEHSILVLKCHIVIL